MNEAQIEMPKYRSHKEVWALKISAIEIHRDGSATIAPKDSGYAPLRTDTKFAERFPADPALMEDGADLGYFVKYKDGYQSWSPSTAFEEGYSRV